MQYVLSPNILSVWGEPFFSIFVLYILFGMLYKSMVLESSLPSKDGFIIPDIDGVMTVRFFRRRALKTKIGKSWTSRFGYFSRPTKEGIRTFFYRGQFKNIPDL